MFQKRLGEISPTENDSMNILISTDKRLPSFDARLTLLEIIHREFQALQELWEISQQLAAKNQPATCKEPQRVGNTEGMLPQLCLRRKTYCITSCYLVCVL